MDTVVVSDDASITASLRSHLIGLGISPSVVRSTTFDKAEAAAAAVPAGLILTHLSTFGPDEIRVVRQLCRGASEGRRVVCVGAARNPKVILELLRDGVYDFLAAESEEELRSNLASVLQRICVLRNEQQGTGKLFGVVGAAGGVGASLIACNMAALIANPAKPCVLIDLDVGGGGLALLLNASPRYNLASLAGKAEQLDTALFDRALLKQDSGIHLLAAPEPHGEARAVTKELLQKVVQLAIRAAPTIVIDFKSVELAEQIRVLPLFDRIVMPLRPDYVSLYRAKKNLEFLQRCKIPLERIDIVVNRVGQPRELPLKCLEEALGTNVSHCLPDDPGIANTSYNLGIPIVVAEPDSSLGRELAKLGARLMGEAVGPASVASQGGWATRMRRWSTDVWRSVGA